MRDYIALALIVAAVIYTDRAGANQGFALHIPTVSYHFDRSEDWNETHPGLFASYDGWFLGGYRNSYDDTSYAFGKAADLIETRFVTIGGSLGLATGYEDRLGGGDIQPIITLDFRWRYLTVSTIPVDNGLVFLRINIPVTYE